MVADLDGTQKEKDNNENETRQLMLYSSYVSAWGSYHEGRNVLLSGYLVAHSFLIATTVLFFVNLKGTGVESEFALLGFSIVGLVLAVQMALAWGRSMNRVSVFEWHLRRLEKAFPERERPTLFTDWDDLQKGRKEKLDNPDDSADEVSANRATKFQSKECWTSKMFKVRAIPIFLVLVYISFLVVAVVELID